MNLGKINVENQIWHFYLFLRNPQSKSFSHMLGRSNCWKHHPVGKPLNTSSDRLTWDLVEMSWWQGGELITRCGSGNHNLDLNKCCMLNAACIHMPFYVVPFVFWWWWIDRRLFKSLTLLSCAYVSIMVIAVACLPTPVWRNNVCFTWARLCQYTWEHTLHM